VAGSFETAGKFVNKHSLSNVRQDSFVNTEATVAAVLVNSYTLLKSTKIY
jgi:hypothetical protein